MTRQTLRSLAPATAAFGLAACLAAPARADSPPAGSWMSGIKLSAQFEGGVTFNLADPKTNFGQLFTDHANQATLNQALFTMQRQIDPKQTGWDVGFKLQGLYGSDARYTHFLGELDRSISTRYQLDIVEANVTLHMPVLTPGGIDLKIGQFPTPLGYETIDPSTNPFYSHSYIFNFGLPLKHTGGLAVVHASPVVDLYLGLDTGVNTSFGSGDNNSAPAGIVGANFTLLGGNLTILALAHIGPENPSTVVPNANNYMRYYNDIVITYKASDKLTLTTELNYIRDDFFKADGGGVAQYAQYALNDTLTLNGRAEVWADGKGFYVGAFPGNLDAVNAQLGNPNTSYGTGRATTYGALTLGVTYKPALPAPVSGLLIRPELRYDTALNNVKPFNGGRDRGAFTIASDFVLGF
ncbi:MAG: porin [Rhodospirillales bacterium]|nr:porin [Rhodospirillales bacterium]